MYEYRPSNKWTCKEWMFNRCRDIVVTEQCNIFHEKNNNHEGEEAIVIGVIPDSLLKEELKKVTPYKSTTPSDLMIEAVGKELEIGFGRIKKVTPIKMIDEPEYPSIANIEDRKLNDMLFGFEGSVSIDPIDEEQQKNSKESNVKSGADFICQEEDKRIIEEVKELFGKKEAEKEGNDDT